MNTTHLNEHDANQGAQSSGEFLGMTGNSGWYLLGSGGATILMVIVLWGIMGVSLLLCLLLGILLGLLSVAYVFLLKNNKPEYYDRDFFESALVEAGVMSFSFGPRARRPLNPFSDCVGETGPMPAETKRRSSPSRSAGRVRSGAASTAAEPAVAGSVGDGVRPKAARPDEMVTRVAFERLREQLTNTEDMLQEALAESGED